MILKELKPRKALNKAFLKVKPNRTEIEGFKTNLITLLERTNDTESEEFHKNLISDFLKDTYYKQNHFINTKGRNDLVIHNGQNANSTVGVIIEAKKPTNKAEMITTQKLNAKAFQELVLYYLRERITHKNLEVKHLVATNINEWFIFDEHLFERLFAQNKSFVRQFENFESSKKTTDVFYKEIAEPFIDSITSEIEFTYFNIQDFVPLLRGAGGVSKHLPNPPQGGSDNSLIALFKLLSPEHLLKLPFANDSNSLDKRFYSELLHIIGLTEIKEGSKKLIERNKSGERHTGTILEDAIIQLDSLDKLSRLDKPNPFGNTQQERLFNVALELSITWINRILFLKLLEAQLITYHKSPSSRRVAEGREVFPPLRGDGGASEYKFLTIDKIKTYDDLNSLFFQVLARRHDERNDDVKKAFEKVPYLNSSLFEPTDIEQATLFISNLKDDKTMPIFSQTVLKDQQGKKRTGNIRTLQYLFEFLDAYDFGAEGSEEIQEDNKTLINASVLGLIFEKINGYKDGSFFTPGFITMYMCRETIRKAVVQKFNEAVGKSPLERGFRGVSNPNGTTRREIIPYNPKLKELARELRNNSTKSEIILWKELKGKFEGKYDFHRQKPLDNYIADFFCHELKLVIEIDGETHNWEETQQKDFQKENRLNELGLNVLRFPDTDIFRHLDATLESIHQYINGFENGSLSELQYEDSPLNPLTGNVGIVETHPQPLSRGEFRSLYDLYEQLGEDRLFTRQQANDIVNSIKICDPAVGSGHFLVSALNEIIAIKNDLKILEDKNGKSLNRYEIEVVNDELIVTDEDGELFEYNPNSKESQRVQETLFHEKQTIIENCLFGVDINPNSVKICRLRLWIELLKNAYYIKNSPPFEGGVAQRAGEVERARVAQRAGVVEQLNNLPHLKTFRKEIRNNLTPAEAKLWTLLQGKQVDGRKFRRQHSFANYILDFYCPEERIAIELDGQGHFEATQAEYDRERDLFLETFGIRVLRFENKWVWDNPEGLLERVRSYFGKQPPRPSDTLACGYGEQPPRPSDTLACGYGEQPPRPSDTPPSKGGELLELQTLPNIDINIKCGNSLVSRFAIDADLKQALKKSKWTIDTYRLAVDTYRNAENREQKKEMERLIAGIKSDFRSEISLNDPKVKKLRKLSGDLYQMTNQGQLFEMSQKEKADWSKKVQQLTEEIQKLEAEIEEKKSNRIYENAFEWRFEFPEVLNDDGDFVGFDVVIGNPPYFIMTKNNMEKLELSHYINNYQAVKNASSKNIFNLFIELGIIISDKISFHSMIVPEGLFETRSYSDTIDLLKNAGSVLNITRIEGMVFDEANTGNVIYIFGKGKQDHQAEQRIFKKNQDLGDYRKNGDPVISKIDSPKTPRLSDFCQLFKGMVVANRKLKIFDEQNENLPNKFLLGSCISKWKIDKYFYTDYESLTIIGGTKAKDKHALFPKILIRRTGDFLCCAYLTEPALTESTLYSCWSLREEIHNLFILGVLHSKVADYFIKNKLVTNPQAFPQILMTDLQSLPIPNPSSEIHNSIKKLTGERLNSSDRTLEIEIQIDQLVYQLYGLTADEIAIIEGGG